MCTHTHTHTHTHIYIYIYIYGETEEEKEGGREGEGRGGGVREDGKGWFSAFNKIRVKRGSHIIMQNYKHLSIPSMV